MNKQALLSEGKEELALAAIMAAGPAADVPTHRTRKPSFYRSYGKRCFDVAFALLSFPIVIPILAILYVWVRKDGGSFLFAHSRVGQNGKPYDCLKIRTMVIDAEARLQHILESDTAAAAEWRDQFKLRDDPRVTRLGRVLRETSFDELPQIFNILKGEMSVVGPRPITREELERYGEAAAAYSQVRPGLTGPWQVSGRRTNDFDSRAAIDCEYVDNMSFSGDLSIVLRTIPEVLSRNGC